MRAERLCVALLLIILQTAMWKLVSSVAEMHWSYGSTLHADRTSPLSAWCCWKSCHCWDARVAEGSSPGQTLLGCVRGKLVVSHSAVCQEQAALCSATCSCSRRWCWLCSPGSNTVVFLGPRCVGLGRSCVVPSVLTLMCSEGRVF